MHSFSSVSSALASVSVAKDPRYGFLATSERPRRRPDPPQTPQSPLKRTPRRTPEPFLRDASNRLELRPGRRSRAQTCHPAARAPHSPPTTANSKCSPLSPSLVPLLPSPTFTPLGAPHHLPACPRAPPLRCSRWLRCASAEATMGERPASRTLPNARDGKPPPRKDHATANCTEKRPAERTTAGTTEKTRKAPQQAHQDRHTDTSGSAATATSEFGQVRALQSRLRPHFERHRCGLRAMILGPRLGALRGLPPKYTRG